MNPIVSFLLKAKNDASRDVLRLKDDLLSLLPAGQKVSALLGGFGGGAGIGIAGAVAGLGAAAVKGATDLANLVERLSGVSKQTGATINEIQVFERMLKNANLSTDDATNALTFLRKEIEKGNPLLKQLNITGTNTTQVFLQLAEKQINAAQTTELLGRKNVELLRIMEDMPDAFAETAKAMTENGGMLDPMTIARAQQLDTLMDTIASSTEDMGTAMKSAALSFFMHFAEITRQADKFLFLLGPIGTALRGIGKAAREAMSKPIEIEGVEVVAERLKNLSPSGALGAPGLRDLRSGLSPRRPGIPLLPTPEEIRDTAGPIFDELTSVKEEYRAWTEEMVSQAGVMRSVFDGALGGIEAGFQSLGRIMLGEKVKIVDITKSMVSELLSQFMRLAAIKFFRFLFFPQASITAMAGGNFSDVPLPIPGAGAGIGGGGAGVNVSIYASDTQSVYNSLTRPSGEWRRVRRSLAER